MTATAVARRAESVLTWRTRCCAAGPGPRSLGAATARWGRIEALRVPALRDLPPYNKARGVGLDAVTRGA
jgi:hypothetical protein